jgi:hypothetical protein
MSRQALAHCALLSCRCGGLIDNDEIKACQLLLMLPKRFSDHSLDTVSRACLATMLFRNSQPKPWVLPLAIAAKHCKEFISTARCFFEHAAERGRR